MPCLFAAQPAGQPEICKKSLHKCSVLGGDEEFIIGKNFTKGTKVTFTEKSEDDVTVWSQDAVIDMEYFQPVSTHHFYFANS